MQIHDQVAFCKELHHLKVIFILHSMGLYVYREVNRLMVQLLDVLAQGSSLDTDLVKEHIAAIVKQVLSVNEQKIMSPTMPRISEQMDLLRMEENNVTTH